MHPAYSIIFFTVASGAGYGLAAMAALLALFGLVPATSGVGALLLVPALGLIVAGLVSSTFHLGRAERAWRALSQWRSSWLSREGVAAVVTFIPLGLFAAGWVLAGEIWALPALLSILGAVVTVVCTAMIYASLKPIRRWHNPWTPAGYLALSFASGALLALMLSALAGAASGPLFVLALLALPLAWAIKYGYWQALPSLESESTAESATGLGRFGKVHLLEKPHSEANYLMREMGFQIARKHADKLRRLALAGGAIGPFLLTLLAWIVGQPALQAILLLVASAGLISGILLERWLFFAEARHTVMLYYGASRA